MHSAVLVKLAAERGDLDFDRGRYIEVFGTEQGGLLYMEFESIVSRPARPSNSGDGRRLMKVYVSIWRVLGASWTEYIAANQRPRKECPPPCEKLLFSAMLMLFLGLNVQGKCHWANLEESQEDSP
jgi:hypothetical protein